MSKLEELKKELKELKEHEFMIQMIDHWDSECYRIDRELHEKIIKVEKEIESYGK